MLGEAATTLLAFALIGLCLLPPGWLVVRVLGVERCRAAWALLLGTATVPGVFYLLARTVGPLAGWSVLAATVAVGIADRSRQRSGARLTVTRGFVAAAVLWVLIGWFCLTDLRSSSGLSLPGATLDYAKHIAVTDAISRTGIPPVNPSFYPEHPVPLFYYYFWFLVCSLADQLGGTLVTARHAVFGGTLWAGFIIVALIRVYATRLEDGMAASARSVAAVALLAVTGLDVLPFFAIHLHADWVGGVPGPLPDLEWWNEQVSAWSTAVIWVPHHVVALAVCLTAFLLLNRPGEPRWRDGAVAAIALSSALGMSIWITLTAAAIAVTWCAVLLYRKRWRALAIWVGAGTGAALLGLRFVADLAASRGSSAAPVVFAVRAFYPLTQAKAFFGVAFECGSGCRLAALPLNYALEFGFFAVATAVYWRWRRRRGTLSTDEQFLLVAAVVSLLLCTFVKSNLAANDLGWRGMMFAQFAGLMWAAPVAAGVVGRGDISPSPRLGRLLKATALLGLIATAMQAIQLRTRPFVMRDSNVRSAYVAIAESLPRDAVLLHNPTVRLEPLHAFYGNRQTVFSDSMYAWLYGVDKADALERRAVLAPLFAEPLPLPEVVATAQRYGATHLVAKVEDPVWQERGSWVWAVTPLIETPDARVVVVADLARAFPRR